MKTSELHDIALDWAVARCLGLTPTLHRNPYGFWVMPNLPGSYSTDWSYGGPIIERELIGLAVELDFTRAAWVATIWPDYSKPCTATATGNTPLIAAMRCFVASKMGGEIELPNELATAPPWTQQLPEGLE